MKVFQRRMLSAQQFVEAGKRIIDRFEHKCPDANYIQGIRTAANQLRQATQELDTLVGMLEFRSLSQGRT